MLTVHTGPLSGDWCGSRFVGSGPNSGLSGRGRGWGYWGVHQAPSGLGEISKLVGARGPLWCQKGPDALPHYRGSRTSVKIATHRTVVCNGAPDAAINQIS